MKGARQVHGMECSCRGMEGHVDTSRLLPQRSGNVQLTIDATQVLLNKHTLCHIKAL